MPPQFFGQQQQPPPQPPNQPSPGPGNRPQPEATPQQNRAPQYGELGQPPQFNMRGALQARQRLQLGPVGGGQSPYGGGPRRGGGGGA